MSQKFHIPIERLISDIFIQKDLDLLILTSTELAEEERLIKLQQNEHQPELISSANVDVTVHNRQQTSEPVK